MGSLAHLLVVSLTSKEKVGIHFVEGVTVVCRVGSSVQSLLGDGPTNVNILLQGDQVRLHCGHSETAPGCNPMHISGGERHGTC